MTFTPSRAYREAHAAPPPGPAEAFARARQIFLDGDKLDVQHLAADLGVHRGTLYRWIGDRDRLLCDVLWAESDSLMTFLRNRCTLVGVDRILEIFHGFVSALAGSVPLRAYLTHEGPKGLSLITSPAAGVRPRVIAAVQEIINVEVAAGRYRPAAPTDELAAGYTSIVEHCLYSNVINGSAPDLIAAKRLGWLLLRET